jgi:mevalonate kinase
MKGKESKKTKLKMKKMIITTAPGKVILFGEHAVVYDKLGIASAVDKRCFITINSSNENNILIDNRGLNLKKAFTEKELAELYEKVEHLKEEKNFDEIREIGKKDKLNAPFFVIANLVKKYGFKPAKILIETNVPKNLGSSSSIFAALALALSNFMGKDLSKKEISDFSYEGDIIAHGGTPSGIDNSVVTYGGYIKYKKSEGTIPLDINFKLPLIFVESGEEAKTGETVPYIRRQREENEKFVNKVLDELNKISLQSLDALINQNLELLGELMFDYYFELKKLNISTEKLDKIVEIAIKSKALGAKPTGGWGGGCCIVLAKNQRQANDLIKLYKEKGFNSFQTKIGVDGVKGIKT